MRMVIAPVTDFSYTTAIREFPVEIAIFVDEVSIVSSRIDIGGALLTRVGEDEAVFGYVKRVSPARRDFIVTNVASPLRKRINLFEYDDNFGNLIAGNYRCEIKAEIYVKINDDIKHREFHGDFIIAIVDETVT